MKSDGTEVYMYVDVCTYKLEVGLATITLLIYNPRYTQYDTLIHCYKQTLLCFKVCQVKKDCKM